MREKIGKGGEYFKRNKWNIILVFILFFIGILLVNLIPNLYFEFNDVKARVTFIVLILGVVTLCLGGGAFSIFLRSQKGIKLFVWCILRCLFFSCIIVGMILLFSNLTFSIRKSYIFGKDSLFVKTIPVLLQYMFFPLLAITYLHALSTNKSHILIYLKDWFVHIKQTILWIILDIFIYWGINTLIQYIPNEIVLFVVSTINATMLWVSATEIFFYRNFGVTEDKNCD